MKSCGLCRKKFRNEAAFDDHVKSDSHKQKVEEVKQASEQKKEKMKATG